MRTQTVSYRFRHIYLDGIDAWFFHSGRHRSLTRRLFSVTKALTDNEKVLCKAGENAKCDLAVFDF
jgi:hypothetical protein